MFSFTLYTSVCEKCISSAVQSSEKFFVLLRNNFLRSWKFEVWRAQDKFHFFSFLRWNCKETWFILKLAFCCNERFLCRVRVREGEKKEKLSFSLHFHFLTLLTQFSWEIFFFRSQFKQRKSSLFLPQPKVRC